MPSALLRISSVLPVLLLSGCFTDAATRLAFDIEAAAGRVGRSEGSQYTLVHRTPSKSGECVGPYKVQLDHVGAIVIWCKDATADKTVSSHSTSYHGRFVDTPETRILDKPAADPLVIELERRGGRVVIASVK
jgi:hypothetical protein